MAQLQLKRIEFIVSTGKICAVKSGINLGAFNVSRLPSQWGFVKITISDSRNNGERDVKQLKHSYRVWTTASLKTLQNFSDHYFYISLQNLKDQILTTNIWLEHEWQDHKFKWDPAEYGGVTELYVPSEHIWLPDIVLYNK